MRAGIARRSAGQVSGPGESRISGFTGSSLLVLGAVLLLYLGWGRAVLERMRLGRRAATAILLLLLLGPLLPDVPVGGGVRVDAAGFLIPVALAGWLVATADRAAERRRALLASLVTGATVFAAGQLLPPRPLRSLPLPVDPVLAYGILAGVVGYLAGRSRRAAFAAALLGLALADLLGVARNALRGVPGPFATLGGGGVFDGTVIAAFVAVLLAEAVGEAREYLARAVPGAPGAGARGAPGAPASVRGGARWARTWLGAALAALAAASAGLGERIWGPPLELTPGELAGGGYYRLVDDAGRMLATSGMRIRPGDGYVDGRDRPWVVVRVEGRLARVRPAAWPELQRLARLPGAARRPQGVTVAPAGFLEALRALLGGGRAASGRPLIVILHTHNDESYILDQGTDSVEGRGGVHRVGEALAAELRRRGYRVIHDQTIHLPHDDNAYIRSRRTILSYLPLKPAMVIDLHRNAAPPEFYADRFRGQGITRVRLVVGRQNPNLAANLRTAREIKAVADRIRPGYVRDIFIGDADFNQDLGPRVILVEVGAHTNALASARRSMALLARVLDEYLRAQPDVW